MHHTSNSFACMVLLWTMWTIQSHSFTVQYTVANALKIIKNTFSRYCIYCITVRPKCDIGEAWQISALCLLHALQAHSEMNLFRKLNFTRYRTFEHYGNDLVTCILSAMKLVDYHFSPTEMNTIKITFFSVYVLSPNNYAFLLKIQ